jgi:ribonuclease BN (tRNA processing enzyme)
MDEDYQRTRTWGHSRFSDAVRLAAEAKVTELGLFHHNQDRPDKGVSEMEEKARQELVRLGSETGCFAVFQDQEIEL